MVGAVLCDHSVNEFRFERNMTSADRNHLNQRGEKMKHFKLVMPVGLVTLFFIAGIAFAQGGGQGKGGQGGAPMMGCQQRFDTMDTNKDGKVSKEEFLAAPHQRENPEQIFKEMDTNGHGYLTKDEFCSGKGMGMGRGMGQGMGQGMGKGMGTGTNK
jgi:hypothetical protein